MKVKVKFLQNLFENGINYVRNDIAEIERSRAITLSRMGILTIIEDVKKVEKNVEEVKDEVKKAIEKAPKDKMIKKTKNK